jgi:hypothetical protein
VCNTWTLLPAHSNLHQYSTFAELSVDVNGVKLFVVSVWKVVLPCKELNKSLIHAVLYYAVSREYDLEIIAKRR